VIVGDDADVLWRHYWANFEPLTELSVQKQHSDREEMIELLANPRVLKIVGREAGRPVGFAMITNWLDDVPELSPRFLRRRYPEHAARNAIYVGVYVVVAPEHRGITLFHRLYLDCWQLVANNAGVLVVDTCEFNRQAFDTDALANRIARAFPNSTVAELDRQTWYAMELPEPMA
jgi:predicted GNAT superfamily acetyltransferase